MSVDRFHTGPHGSLTAAGFGRHWVDVDYGAGGLVLYGLDDQRLDAPWSSMTKERIRYSSLRYSKSLYQTTIWTSAAPRPRRAKSIHRDEPNFAAIVRTVAVRTLSARGKRSLEGGFRWGALLLPLDFAAMMVLATHATISGAKYT